MHWYAVTALAAFVVAALVLRRRAALPVAGVGALAVLPAAAMVAVNLASGVGGRNAEHLRSTDGRLAGLALDAWANHRVPLLALLLALMAVGAVRATGVRAVATAWATVPLVLLTLGELVRPLYLPRYLLVGLLGVGVLAAAGACALPRPARLPAAGLLLVLSLLACQPVFDRGPRERGDDLVALLVEVHAAGEPVVAADQRSALALDHYTRLLAPELRPDVVLPPADAPADADRVWLVRRLVFEEPEPTDDDGILRDAGLAQRRQWELFGGKTDLVLQLWTR
jgi:mannosyltransferase